MSDLEPDDLGIWDGFDEDSYNDGYNEGYKVGYGKGHSDGYDDGISDARRERGLTESLEPQILL